MIHKHLSISKDCFQLLSKRQFNTATITVFSSDRQHIKHVAAFVGQSVGLSTSRILTGADLNHISSEALVKLATDIDIFAEIAPNQKEQIILALRRRTANVVGYMGDGINDASALHVSDAGISVDTASEVLKETADFVLLEKNLDVLVKGVQEG